MRILVLPGLGDIYWIAVLLKSFLAKHGLERAEMSIWNFDGRPRSADFVRRIPFVDFGGYFEHPDGISWARKDAVFQDSHRIGERWVYPGYAGFDYYLAVNGWIAYAGKTIEAAAEAEGLEPPDWNLELLTTPTETLAELEFQARYPNGYVVAFFSDHGMFRNWVQKWGARGCADLVAQIRRSSGLPVLLTGLEWDLPFARRVMIDLQRRKLTDGIENLCTRTPPDRFVGMLRGAAGVVGWCGGNTILSTHLRVPTLMGWSSTWFKQPRFFQTAVCTPSWGKWYAPFVVEGSRPTVLARTFLELLERDPRKVPVELEEPAAE